MTNAPPDTTRTHALEAKNLQLVPQPYRTRSFHAFTQVFAIVSAYWNVSINADLVMVRGLCPFTSLLYAVAWLHSRPVVHWVVGNAAEVARCSKRGHWFYSRCAILYASLNRFVAMMGTRLTQGLLLCNGGELARLYGAARTSVVISSAIDSSEIRTYRQTCTAGSIRLVFVGFIRPEKGLDYLLDAVALLSSRYRLELVVVGATDHHPRYAQELRARADRLLADGRVSWMGYVPFGSALFDVLDSCDIFVLPSLSEGTPRVILEAQARSLPVVATAVGGIPSIIVDGKNGLLVRRGDAKELANAVVRMMTDTELRERIARQGLEDAKRHTVEAMIAALLPRLLGCNRASKVARSPARHTL